MSDDVIVRIYEAFSADNLRAVERVRSGETKLAHYTSAENGLKILTSGEFWLRNTRCMNDYSEVRHGKDLILRTLTGNDRRLISRLENTLNKCGPDAFKAFVQSYGTWLDGNSDTFIGCLSEHDPNDARGRLSMWRAYGSNRGGVCFIFNSTPFMAESDVSNVYSVPVSYYTDDEFAIVLDNISAGLEQVQDELCDIPLDDLVRTLTMLFVFRAISLKHPGFVEESEWRIVLLPEWGFGDAVGRRVVSLGGIPQVVHTVPLRDDPEQGLFKADIPSLLAKVIIGPSEFPYVVWDAYVARLTEMGVENASEKVVISGIPLRAVR